MGEGQCVGKVDGAVEGETVGGSEWIHGVGTADGEGEGATVGGGFHFGFGVGWGSIVVGWIVGDFVGTITRQ